MSEEQGWIWREGPVDRRREHLALSYDAWDLPVAVVGPPVDGVFPVGFIEVSDGADPASEKARDAVRRELDFYLVELGEPDPWAYAIYHCGTTSNVYSQVHWSWYPGSTQGETVGGERT